MRKLKAGTDHVSDTFLRISHLVTHGNIIRLLEYNRRKMLDPYAVFTWCIKSRKCLSLPANARRVKLGGGFFFSHVLIVKMQAKKATAQLLSSRAVNERRRA